MAVDRGPRGLDHDATIDSSSADRGQAVPLIQLLMAVGLIAIIIAMLTTPIAEIQEQSRDINDGTEYEEMADNMSQRNDAAYRALPQTFYVYGFVFIVAMAILLSSR